MICKAANFNDEAEKVNPGDEGLLEYMEDIIGTNQYVEPIEEAGKKLEELSEKRGGMVSRLARRRRGEGRVGNREERS